MRVNVGEAGAAIELLAELAHEHVDGAVSVPLDQVKEWARTAPRRRPVVAYCRGPYCVHALDALAELRKRGIRGLRAEDGVSEWRAAGLPVAVAAS